MTATKRFSIGAILAVTDGRLFCEFAELQEMLSWITRDDLFTHQCIRAADEAAPYLREWFPDLAAVVVPDRKWDEASVTEWLATLGEQYRDVPQMPDKDHAFIDPLLEMQHMVGADRVIPIAIGEPA